MEECLVQKAEKERTYGPPYIYIIDNDGWLWKGRLNKDDNLHWARCEGIYSNYELIWVLRSTYPPEHYKLCLDIENVISKITRYNFSDHIKRKYDKYTNN